MTLYPPIKITSLIVALLAAMPLVAQTALPDSVTDAVDPDDEAIRTGLVEIPGEADDIDIAIPTFIHRNSNRINLNGADWSQLKQSFRQSNVKPVSVVLIGDSHIQADVSSAVTRELLQYDFGNAGRGMIAPLKMSGTNQPSDYTFQSRDAWNTVKLMSATWKQTVGFNGTSIHPVRPTGSFTIATSDRDDYNPFTSLTIFHNGKMTIQSVTATGGGDVHFRAIPSRDYTQILMSSPQTSVDIRFSSAGDLTIFGASLSSGTPGVFYHAIGNNGAAYDTYNRIGNVGSGLSHLSPQLVIISLGTNEAFGKLDLQGFNASVDRLVNNIRASNPKAQILLTTPMECHKSVTTYKKVRVKRKGKKGGYTTVNKKVKSYTVCANIAPLRDAIIRYGAKKGIAVYDWYEVAGGRGASNTWINGGYFAADRVHHSRKGYVLEGRLVYEALLDALRN